MKFIVIIILISIKIIPAGIDDKYSIIPKYYEAVKMAADGNFEIPLKVFTQMDSVMLKWEDPKLLILLCGDIINGELNKEAGEYLFKSLDASYDKLGDSDELFFLNRAFGINREYSITYIFRAKFYLKQKKYEFALDELNSAVELKPETFFSYFYRAKTYYLMDNFNQAIDDLNSSIEMDSHFGEAYMLRSEILDQIGNIDLSVKDLITARMIDSTLTRRLDVSARLNKYGVFYLENKEYLKSEQALTESIISDSRWNEPFLNRGIVFKNTGEYSKAIKDFNKALSLKENADGFYNRGLVYKELNKTEEAKKDLEKAILLDDKHEKAYRVLGELYYYSTNLDKAIFYFQKIISVNKNNLWAYYWLGLTFDKAKNYKKAILYYKEFLEKVTEKDYKQKIIIEKRLKMLKS